MATVGRALLVASVAEPGRRTAKARSVLPTSGVAIHWTRLVAEIAVEMFSAVDALSAGLVAAIATVGGTVYVTSVTIEPVRTRAIT